VEQQLVSQHQTLLTEAESFLAACYKELGKSQQEAEARVLEVRAVIARDGSYTHTAEELEYGAKVAWRNSNRCIGRLFWETLHVIDARDAQTEEEMAHALFHHIEYATNGGKIRPTITMFRPADSTGDGPRIWNYQLVRYAGYEADDGNGVIGDPDSLKLTKLCQSMGWSGAGTPFDVLPLVLQRSSAHKPRLFEIPSELVLEVPISHPDYEQFTSLGLQWYAVPMVSNMRLEIGGLNYLAAPFNGWYMGTEIGARNLADTFRYDKLPQVADLIGLNRSRESDLWRDRALVELNIAVLHSFKAQGVTIVDHHTAAKQFAHFQERERRSEREITGEWTWLIPPVSPATTHIFHSHYDNRIVNPNYHHQPDPF